MSVKLGLTNDIKQEIDIPCSLSIGSWGLLGLIILSNVDLSLHCLHCCFIEDCKHDWSTIENELHVGRDYSFPILVIIINALATIKR